MTAEHVVLVTGAGSGIGRSTALLYAAQGDQLVLVGRRRRALEEVERECRRVGARDVLVCPADVTDAAAGVQVVDEALLTFGRIDVCVHAAGVAAYGPIEELPLDALDRVIEINLLGAVRFTRPVLAAFREAGSGTLVLIGSVLGRIAVPSMGAYVISKWAVRALARVLELETRDLPGVRVCLVSPGSVDTSIYRDAANWTGRRPRPPWPVAQPDSVARAVVRTVQHPRRERLTGWASPLMVAGSAVLPRLYDRIVGPLMGVAGFHADAAPSAPGNLWRGLDQ